MSHTRCFLNRVDPILDILISTTRSHVKADPHTASVAAHSDFDDRFSFLRRVQPKRYINFTDRFSFHGACRELASASRYAANGRPCSTAQ